jgi:SAM-dependent methyltransferase
MQSDFLYWEKRGETYKDLDDVRSKRTAYNIVRMMKPFGINYGSWILDAGCGRGTITKVVKDNFRHSNVVGVDLSESMIDGAKLKKGPGLKFVCSDFFNFIDDFEDFYSVTIMSLFIHHLLNGNDEKALRKIYEATKPNGHVLIAEAIPPADSIIDEYRRIFSLKENRNCYLLSDLLKMMRGAGFIDLKFITYRFDIRLLSWLNDKTLQPGQKHLLYSLHTEASREFKDAYSMEALQDKDYRLRCKMAILTGKKS